MPRDRQILLFVGIKSSVVALDDRTGTEIWRLKLRSSDYVTVLWDGEALFAANAGEIWRIDPERGTVLWHNELKGMGRGIVGLASTRLAQTSADSRAAAEKHRRDAEAAAAGG